MQLVEVYLKHRKDTLEQFSARIADGITYEISGLDYLWYFLGYIVSVIENLMRPSYRARQVELGTAIRYSGTAS